MLYRHLHREKTSVDSVDALTETLEINFLHRNSLPANGLDAMKI